MAAPIETDVILDADGKAVVSAFEFIQLEITRIQKAVREIGKDSYKNVDDFGKALSARTKELQNALGQMRTLSGSGTAFGDYDKALKQAQAQSKGFFSQTEAARKESLRNQMAAEREAARTFSDLGSKNLEDERKRQQIRRQLLTDNARATMAENVRLIQSDREVAEARARSNSQLSKLRQMARTEGDTVRLGDLQVAIRLEKERGALIERRGREISSATRQEEQAQARVTTEVNKTFTAQQKLTDQIAKTQRQRERDYEAAIKASGRVGITASQKQSQMNAMWGDYDARNAAPRGMTPAERAGELAVARMNQRVVQQEAEATKNLQTLRAASSREKDIQDRARLNSAKAQVAMDARLITDENQLAIARAKAAEMTERLVRAQAKESDPKQLAAIERLLQIENARTVALERQQRQLERNRREQERGGAQTGGSSGGNPLSDIFSGSYAATALARTSVYGLAASAAYGAFNSVQSSIQGVIQLEDEMAKLQAISDTTDEGMQRLRSSIFSIGETSRYSISDLTKVAQTLAQAGIGAKEMADVLSSVTTLATASGSTPDEAVNLITAALGSFQLQGREASRIADLMTTALNRTKLTVSQVGLAIQYVGATAYEQNITLEQLLATVGAIAQGGVRNGSTIGTGLRQFLVDLQTPSEKLTGQMQRLGITQDDINVKTRGLSAVIQTLTDKGFGASQAYEGLEVRAAAAYLVLKNNVDVVSDLQLAFAQQGAAAIANERAMNTLTAQWQRFKNVLQEGLAEGLEEPMIFLKNVVRALADRIAESRQAAADIKAANAEGRASALTYDVAPMAEDNMRKYLNAFGQISTLGQYNSIVGQGFGDYLNSWFKDTKDATAATQVFGQAINDANAEVEKHAQILMEADKEMARLRSQQGSLINDQKAAQAETVTLTSRFEGLVKFLGTTKNAYMDLINAMGEYRAEESRFLAQAYDGQVAAQQKQNNLDRAALTQSIATIRGDSTLMNRLSPQERAALNNPNDINFAARMREAADRLSGSMGNAANALNDASILSSRLSVGTRTAERGRTEASVARAQGTELGAQVQGQLQIAQDQADKLRNRPQGDRTRLGNETTLGINKYIDSLQKRLPQLRDAGNRQMVEDAIEQFKSILNQIKGSIQPTKEEIEAAKKEAREQKAREAELRRRPVVTQADIDKVGQGLGLKTGSGTRTPEEQESLFRRGVTTARGYASRGRVSNHVNGIARDFSVAGLSDREAELKATTLRAQYRAQGIEAQVKYERGGRNDGTGRHIHVGVRPGTRFGKDREAEVEDRYDADLDRARVELAQRRLQTQVKEIGRQTTQATFEEAVKNARETLNKVNDAVKDSALSELASKGIDTSSEQGQARLAQVEDQIAQNIADFNQKVSDAIIKGIDGMLKAADRAFTRAMQPSRNAQAIAEGVSSGLGYASNAGRVPDFVVQTANRNAQVAREQTDRAELSALPARIAAQRSQIAEAQNNPLLDTDMKRAKVEELTQALEALEQRRMSLEAAFGASGLIPITISGAFQMAATEYAKANNLTATFKETVIANVGGAIGTVHTGLTSMFSDIFSGSQSALGAFGNFATGIMKYMQQLAAQYVAMQALKGLFSLFGLAMPTSTSSVVSNVGTLPVGTDSFGPVTYAHEGGRMGYDSGGRVMNGNVNSDSVNAKLAKDEWVVRRKAVESVGHGFMAQLNQHGAGALQQASNLSPMSISPKQSVSVFVVPPDQVPSMGPQDVLATFANDVLSGGESKKLIKYVMHEG